MNQKKKELNGIAWPEIFLKAVHLVKFFHS